MSLVQSTIKPVKGGTIGGTNQSTGALIPTTEGTTTFGGSSSLMGLAWTPGDVNASNFGVAISVSSNASFAISHYLKATNFGFSIDSGATITGIEFDVKWKSAGNGTSSGVVSVNLVTATVYYTPPSSSASAGTAVVAAVGVAASVTISGAATPAATSAASSSLAPAPTTTLGSLSVSDATATLAVVSVAPAVSLSGSGLTAAAGTAAVGVAATDLGLESGNVAGSADASVRCPSPVIDLSGIARSAGTGIVGVVGVAPSVTLAAVSLAAGTAVVGVAPGSTPGVSFPWLAPDVAVGAVSVAPTRTVSGATAPAATAPATGVVAVAPTPIVGGTIYMIYANDGAGGVVDYAAPIGTTSALTFTTGTLAADSDWTFAVRAKNAYGEETNTDARTRVILDSGRNDVTSLPLAPTQLTARPLASGGMRVEWSYPYPRATNQPTGFHVYHDAGTGTVDYATVRATVNFGLASLPSGYATAGFLSPHYRADLSGLSDGTAYKFGVRAFNAAAEEGNTDIVTATADATAPSSVDSLAGVAA